MGQSTFDLLIFVRLIYMAAFSSQSYEFKERVYFKLSTSTARSGQARSCRPSCESQLSVEMRRPVKHEGGCSMLMIIRQVRSALWQRNSSSTDNLHVPIISISTNRSTKVTKFNTTKNKVLIDMFKSFRQFQAGRISEDEFRSAAKPVWAHGIQLRQPNLPSVP